MKVWIWMFEDDDTYGISNWGIYTTRDAAIRGLHNHVNKVGNGYFLNYVKNDEGNELWEYKHKYIGRDEKEHEDLRCVFTLEGREVIENV